MPTDRHKGVLNATDCHWIDPSRQASLSLHYSENQGYQVEDALSNERAYAESLHGFISISDINLLDLLRVNEWKWNYTVQLDNIFVKIDQIVFNTNIKSTCNVVIWITQILLDNM